MDNKLGIIISACLLLMIVINGLLVSALLTSTEATTDLHDQLVAERAANAATQDLYQQLLKTIGQQPARPSPPTGSK